MVYNQKDLEDVKKHYFEMEKLKQEIELLKNQNNDFKATKQRSNWAIWLSVFAILVEVTKFLVEQNKS